MRERAQARLTEIRGRKARYDADFGAFAADCLKIRPKEGGDTLFRLNPVQKRVHAELEKMRRETGQVRVIIVKARQPGISTLVVGRDYHRVSRNRGLRAFILTHEQPATDNVFEMVQRFHESNPHAPHTSAASAKELVFDELDSGFEVGTAGAKGIGRSYTIQLLHWSEVAWSPNAEMHAAGLLQAVPDAPGTEIVLESTANGIGNLFYNMAIAAERGIGKFRLIFIPWFEHDEYVIEPPKDWRAPPDLAEYADKYDLTPAQAYWADVKNTELAVAEGEPATELCWKFHQEYPATMQLAFRASRKGSFINGEDVFRARKFTAPAQDFAPLTLGCDFATGGDGEGGDSNLFIDRQGRRAGKRVYERFIDKNTVSVASKLGEHIDKLKPAMTFLDKGGGGAQVYDILVSRGYAREKLTLVDFGGKPRDGRKYGNKRAEMYGDMRDWLKDPGGADIPDDDKLEADLTASKPNPDFSGRAMLEKKDLIRKRLKFSPDGSDALGLTFAETIHINQSSNLDPLKRMRRRKGWQAA